MTGLKRGASGLARCSDCTVEVGGITVEAIDSIAVASAHGSFARYQITLRATRADAISRVAPSEIWLLLAAKTGSAEAFALASNGTVTVGDATVSVHQASAVVALVKETGNHFTRLQR